MTAADDALGPFLLGGAVAAAGVLAWRASKRPSGTTPINPAMRIEPDPDNPAWIHPVPTLNGRLAVTSNEFRASDSADGKARQHLGVDLMYRRRDSRDLIAAFPAGTPAGTPLFFMPADITAFAAAAGTVTFAGMTPLGNAVILRHANGWATYYAHLATLAVHKGDSVPAGQVLGTIGASPQDPAHLRHLHFEIWKSGTREGAVDPDLYIAAWSRLSIVLSLDAPVTSSSPSPRNGSLTSYRPVGESGEPYPEWVRRLRGQSGVYVIREIDGPIVYVGSSIGRLYDTLTRHFQTWRRFKGFWRGQYGEGADPGLTYKRNRVEVAIKLTTPDDAHDEELRMIRRLAPQDNQLGQREHELEEAPF